MFKFLPRQWKLVANAISNVAQAVIIFSLGAIFVPETVNLFKGFSRLQAIVYLIAGLLILLIGAILMRKGNN